MQGLLSAGHRLPSSRDLAKQLGVTRNTVLTAYEELLAEGVLVSRQGSGTYINPEVLAPQTGMAEVSRNPKWMQKPLVEVPVAARGPEGMIEFRAGQPSLEGFDQDSWKSIWKTVAAAPLACDYQDAQGDLVLREQVAQFVRRTRGIHCTPRDVLITSGTIHALNLIARVTLDPGNPVAFEEPGFPLARAVFRHHQAEVVPVSIDEDGMRVQELPSHPAPVLIYTTPSHQFPLGHRMSLPRREALLRYALEHDSLILEDDYESEFRFDVPLPALASMDQHGLVAYIGTLSKVLSPVIRLGYIVASPALIERISRLRKLSDYQHSSVLQLAMQHMIQQGYLDRHIRSMRRIYAQKRQMLKEGLKELAPHCRLIGIEAGLHGFLQLPDHLPYLQVQQACQKRGVLVESPERYYGFSQPLNGLVLGYGGLNLQDIQTGARVIREVVLELLQADSP